MFSNYCDKCKSKNPWREIYDWFSELTYISTDDLSLHSLIFDSKYQDLTYVDLTGKVRRDHMWIEFNNNRTNAHFKSNFVTVESSKT